MRNHALRAIDRINEIKYFQPSIMGWDAVSFETDWFYFTHTERERWKIAI